MCKEALLFSRDWGRIVSVSTSITFCYWWLKLPVWFQVNWDGHQCLAPPRLEDPSLQSKSSAYADTGPEQSDSVSSKLSECCCCSFLISSLAVLKWQLNEGFLQAKAKIQPPNINTTSSNISVLGPGKQTHLGKLAISLLSCNFFVLISWEKLLWGMITMAKYLIKHMKLLLCYW